LISIYIVIDMYCGRIEAMLVRTTRSPASDLENGGSTHTRLDVVIDAALARKSIVGCVVMVAQRGRMLYQRAAGFADREAEKPMQLDTLFRLASMTKPIVSTVTMALIERGRLGLADRVSQWIPEFSPRLTDGREAVITVRHLLTHTAGLSYGFLEPEDSPYNRANVSDGLDQPGLGVTENLRRIASVPLTFEPGQSWRYSLATDVLGELLHRVGGVPLPELIATLVTKPLRMRNTGFRVDDLRRLATPYADGSPEPLLMGDHHTVLFGSGRGISFAPARIFDHFSYPSGGAGMVGTAADFMLFLEALRTGGTPILSSQSVEMMTTNQTGSLLIDAEGPGWGFGFCAAVLTDPQAAQSPQSTGTYRWGGAYGHSWFADPKRELTVVALTNTAVEGMSGNFPMMLRNAVYS
jgi:CubicO group peptidase (beta-lactamase class C family)